MDLPHPISQPSQPLAASDRLLQGIAIATNCLLTIEDDRESVQAALNALGHATNVDRIYIFENHPHPDTGLPALSQRWEWVAEGVRPEIDNPNLQNLSYPDILPRWHTVLSQQRPILGLINTFPEPEQRLLAPQGIQSIIVVPIFIRDHFWGFAGFDDCHQERHWNDTTKAALMAIAGSIGGAISQRRAEANLKQLNLDLEQRVKTRTAQLQSAKEAADAANRAKSEFLANMSHELRTPLNGILGYAQILAQVSTLPEKERHGIDIIYQCGSHLLTLINDILDLAKIEARKLDLVPTAVHLPSLLQSVVELCKIKAEQKGIGFIYQSSSRLPAGVEADGKRLRQVLINLIGNAIKFTDAGAVTLQVDVLAQSDTQVSLLFQTIDTGMGLAEEEIDRLFQAFEQVGNRQKQAEGTGLGLAISQRIVQLMGSTIQVKSQLGEGSEFFFIVDLPLVADWVQQQRNDERRIIGYEGSRLHLLVVDDRWENRAVLRHLLEPLDFNILEAENGEAGLAQLHSSRTDLVILDLAMPVMDGFEFLRQIRQVDEFRQTRVIVSSASVSPSDQQLALNSGGNDFLAKPVDASLLFQRLSEQLNLTWIYEDASCPGELTPAPIRMLPSTGDLEQLLDWAKSGLILDIQDWIAQEQSGDYAEVAAHLDRWAREFQLKEIRLCLERWLAAD